MKNQKGFSPLALLIIAAVILIGLVAFGRFYYLPKVNENKNANTNQVVVNTNENQNQNANLNQNTNSTIVVNGNANTNANTNSAVDETANWKTYTNSIWGFSLKYPSEWTIVCDKLPKELVKYTYISTDSLVLGQNAACNQALPNAVSLTVSINPDAFEGYNYNKVLIITQKDNGYVITKENNNNVEDNTRYSAQAMDSSYTDNSKNDKKFVFTYNEPINNGIKDTILRKILSTFQFTDETVSWKTYTNTEKGFGFKYPSDWTAIPLADEGSLSSLVALKSPLFSPAHNIQGEICVGRFTNPNNISLPAYWQLVNDLGVTATPVSATINGFEAQRLDKLSNPQTFPSPRTQVHIKAGNTIYSFDIQNVNGNFEEQIETFNQIVATFFIFKD